MSTCRAACVAMHSRQKECVQPSLIAPPSEPQTSMHTAQSCLLPPTVRGHHGLCCIFAFFLRRCGVPAPKVRCSGFGQLALRRLLSAPDQASGASKSSANQPRRAAPAGHTDLGFDIVQRRSCRGYRASQHSWSSSAWACCSPPRRCSALREPTRSALRSACCGSASGRVAMCRRPRLNFGRGDRPRDRPEGGWKLTTQPEKTRSGVTERRVWKVEFNITHYPPFPTLLSGIAAGHLTCHT